MRKRKLQRPEQDLPEPETRRLLDASDVAERLHISQSHAYNLMRCGAIVTVRLGRNVRVTEADLQTFIQGQRQEPRQDWRERMQLLR